jgi:hypothetical protein
VIDDVPVPRRSTAGDVDQPGHRDVDAEHRAAVIDDRLDI